MRRNVLFIALLTGLAPIVKAQLSTNEEPVIFRESKPIRPLTARDIRTMPALSMSRIEQEDARDEAEGLPPRFGYLHRVNFDMDSPGSWQELIWQLTLRCPQALSINLLYDKLWLPEGGKLFIYTTDRKHSMGAFTSANNKGDRANAQGFATGLLYGDEVVLEYFLPTHTAERAIISIAYVVQGYRYIKLPGVEKGLGASASCQVNISCPEGQNWRAEKNAIARVMVVSGYGSGWCTCSLFNSTNNDKTPYVLISNHFLQYDYGNNLFDAISNPNMPLMCTFTS